VLATSPYVLVLSPAFSASSVQDVIARARAKPGQVIAATPGLGSVGHFATIELEMLAHIDLLQVPYKGLGPAVSDVVAGHVNMMFDMLATSLPLHQAGTEKIVAVGGAERVKALPDVPTLAESGVPGFRAVTFFGIVAPPGTPDALADKINRDVDGCLSDTEFVDKTKVLGMDLTPRSRAETAKFFTDERNLWGKVIKTANIPMQ
jgi:tripartite-type tricarboxylate transporter receptor subunit TctC